jgi:hypothetical protein
VIDGPDNIGAAEPESEEPDSPRARLVQRLVAVVVLLVVGVVFVRFAIPPVTATQARPAGHPPGSCVLCHLVTAEGTSGR